MGIKWIKITTDMFDDEKIKVIQGMPEGSSILIIWIRLLSLAGKCNHGGKIYLCEDVPYTDELLSSVFNMPIPVIRMAIETFVRLGMVVIEGGVIEIVNWRKYQFADALDKIREDNRIRKQAQRLRESQSPEEPIKDTLLLDISDNVLKETKENNNKSKNVTKSRDSHVTVTGQKPKVFVIPSIAEISAYCKERNNNVDPNRFFNFYESKGWKVGNAPMKNWQAAVRTWEGNSFGDRSGGGGGVVRPADINDDQEARELNEKYGIIKYNDTSWTDPFDGACYVSKEAVKAAIAKREEMARRKEAVRQAEANGEDE